MAESAIAKHNRELTEKYLAENKVYSRYPKVSEQVECVPLDTSGWHPFAYNPSIATKHGGFLVVYRWHPPQTKSHLAFVELDDSFQMTNKVEFGEGEDPKLFKHEENVFCSYVDSTYPKRPFRSVVKYFIGGDAHKQPPLPGNDGTTMQKNWVFFYHKDVIYCIYQASPVQQVYQLDPLMLMESPALKWPYGELRGGTAPIEYEGKYLRFFHSSLDNEWGGLGHPRRYFVGAVLMDNEPPFKQIAVSKKPIIYGSEIDDLKVSKRPFHWKSNVVFCSGAIPKNNVFIVSVGVNDSACVLTKIHPNQFNF